MSERKFKIGFSDVGGIFIGKDVQSNWHQHYAQSLLISFGEPFTIQIAEKEYYQCSAALIQKNVGYRLTSGKHDFLAFMHIVPHSEIGQYLHHRDSIIKILTDDQVKLLLDEIKDWFASSNNDQEDVKNILQSIVSISDLRGEGNSIDPRVLNAIQWIMQCEDERIPVDLVSKKVGLSVSHLQRLMKKETGLTFRQFVLHSKLIKSIYALYLDNNLTAASFIGGFSDQPHLTRTFKSNFGIKPSTALK